MITLASLLLSEKAIFPESPPLVTLVDSRNIFERVYDLGVSIIHEVISRYNRRYNPLLGRSSELFHRYKDEGEEINYDVEDCPWNTHGSKKLIVFIHGLNSSPLSWSKYLQKLPKDPQTHYFAPYVVKKGYCSVESAAAPILRVLKNYGQQHPSSSIYLVGHSLGARIAGYLDRQLCTSHDTKLISIAGPHYGTKCVTTIRKLGLTHSLGLSPEMLAENHFGGEWSKTHVNRWREQSKQVVASQACHRLFFASADDLRIYPSQTCFPLLPNSSYHLLKRESHVTIIEAVQEAVFSFVFEAP